jgi:sporulation protein YlmC with PRC-barrel domain
MQLGNIHHIPAKKCQRYRQLDHLTANPHRADRVLLQHNTEMTMIRRLFPCVTLGLMGIAAAQAQQPVAADTPTTVVSTVRLENGLRASKLIGAPVYNAQNEHIGDVSELYLSKQNQIANVVIQVGGFLGIGGKLVSVPMAKLQLDQADKVVMPDGTKDTLKAAPSAEYAG